MYTFHLQRSASKKEDDPNDAKRPRLDQDGQKYVDVSSPWPKDAVSCDEEMRSESTDACAGDGAVLCRQGPEEETPSTSGSAEVTEHTAEPPGASSSSDSSLQNNNTYGTHSRKTPARQSKGSGRLCTACPCGTKVGVMPAIPSPKPQDSVTHSSGQAKTLRDCSAVHTVLENSVSNPKTSSDVSDKPGDEKAHTDRSNVNPRSLQKTASHTTQIEGIGEPDMSSKQKTCSSITSPKGKTCESRTEGKTCESRTGGPAAPTTTQEPSSPTELVLTAPASSFPKIVPRNAGKGPTEFYSSIMLDPEEVERRQRISRLKDLLKQKEAALEKLRKSM